MSAGPIAQERRGYLAAAATTTKAERVHAAHEGRRYCGARAGNVTPSWDRVTCENCLAAHRADEAAS